MSPTAGAQAGEPRPVPPRTAALAILAQRFGDETGDTAPLAGLDVRLTDHQRDAVTMARRILDERRGVVVADSVGLGKTFIGLALVEDVVRQGGRVAVITPAALGPDWCRHLRRLARAFDLPAVAGPGAAPRPGRLLAWLSHTRLSRGTHSPDRLAPLDLVVVDEAHAFRSPGTRRYRALAELCRGTRVVLVTATPVNNSLLDLYFLLRLFAGDATFRDLGIPDLGAAFRDVAGAPPGFTPPPWLAILLRAVVIRRTRALLDLGGGAAGRGGAAGPEKTAYPAGRFPRRSPPVVVRYDLDGATAGVTANLVRELEALTLAPLRLGDYGAPFRRRPGGGEAELIRLGLLKRLESSRAAFHASVLRQLRYYRQFLDALARGRLLPPPEFRTLYAGDGDAVQLVLEGVALRGIPAGLRVDRLGADARTDLRRLERLARLVRPEPAADPKLARLTALLDRELLGCKAALFTEYRDTARYLWRALATRGRVALVDGSGAFLGIQPATRRAVIRRFAPRSNGARPPSDRERVDLLVATDVLAEGLNLQDAGRVVCYDLPWNPVRLIQRIGRVDRLGSPHAEVHVYNFVPDRGLEEVLGLLRRLRRKLAAIHGTVGAEGGVLEPHDHIAADRVPAYWADDRSVEAAEAADAAPYEPVERLRAAYRTAFERRSVRPDVNPVPPLGLVRGHDDDGLVLAAYAAGGRAVWVVVRPDGTVAPDPDAAAMGLLLRALDDDAVPPARVPDRRGLRRALRLADAELRRRVGLESPVAGAVAARAARRLMRALAAVAVGPSPGLCSRADAVLAALAGPLDAGAEFAVRRALRGGDDAEGLVAEPESPSGGSAPAGSAATDHPSRAALVSLLAALEKALAPHAAAAGSRRGSGSIHAGGIRHGTGTEPGLHPGATRLVGVLRGVPDGP